ncbi:hypothetical protein SAY86_000828 [Trapa natans]|uniref:Uncharacterized protein n=1 Tax=Trapa natans TaxID=22666 RepID=A0AAN7RH07_TRANT|nr:hypothetical protein SAY86_000828 [Trapa natans]
MLKPHVRRLSHSTAWMRVPECRGHESPRSSKASSSSKSLALKLLSDSATGHPILLRLSPRLAKVLPEEINLHASPLSLITHELLHGTRRKTRFSQPLPEDGSSSSGQPPGKTLTFASEQYLRRLTRLRGGDSACETSSLDVNSTIFCHSSIEWL